MTINGLFVPAKSIGKPDFSSTATSAALTVTGHCYIRALTVVFFAIIVAGTNSPSKGNVQQKQEQALQLLRLGFVHLTRVVDVPLNAVFFFGSKLGSDFAFPHYSPG